MFILDASRRLNLCESPKERPVLFLCSGMKRNATKRNETVDRSATNPSHSTHSLHSLPLNTRAHRRSVGALRYVVGRSRKRASGESFRAFFRKTDTQTTSHEPSKWTMGPLPPLSLQVENPTFFCATVGRTVEVRSAVRREKHARASWTTSGG